MHDENDRTGKGKLKKITHGPAHRTNLGDIGYKMNRCLEFHENIQSTNDLLLNAQVQTLVFFSPR